MFQVSSLELVVVIIVLAISSAICGGRISQLNRRLEYQTKRFDEFRLKAISHQMVTDKHEEWIEAHEAGQPDPRRQ